MPTSKNHKRIYVVLIICIGAIVSVWLLNQAPKKVSLAENIKELSKDISVRPYIETETSDNWEKILTTVDQKDQPVTDLTKNNPSTFDDSTLTAQMSKDFFGQYLIAKRGGKTLSDEEMATIASNITSSPLYTKSTGVVYVPANLKIDTSTNSDDLSKYKENVNLILKNLSENVKESPLVISADAITLENEEVLKKLDPIILAGKATITQLLNTEVPKDLSNLHLALINTGSSVLYDLESMRQFFTDPIRGVIGFSAYTKHFLDFKKVTDSMNSYLSSIR